ncbi:MAG: hypothetical protein WAN97_00905, partial [Candidatus Acidiferrales bacterium]
MAKKSQIWRFLAPDRTGRPPRGRRVAHRVRHPRVYNFEMKICIVQLSDIHVKRSDDSVLGRGRSVATSAINAASSADAYLLAVSGDIAFSGRSEQYKLAERFLGEVRSQLERAERPVFV